MKFQTKSVLTSAVFSFAALACTQGTSAADITLSGSDAGGTQSFSSGLNWTGGAAPTSGNNYFTGANTLRTDPAASGVLPAFAGDSLSVDTGGLLSIEAANNQSLSVTINNLILNGGEIRWNRNSDRTLDLNSNSITLATGTNSSITSGDSRFRKVININAPISGDGSLTMAARIRTFFNGINTHTGDTTLNLDSRSTESEYHLTDSSAFLFDIGDGGSNQINGTGRIFLEGRLNLDVTDVTTSNSWTLVDIPNFLANTYDPTFDIGFNGGGSFVDGGGVWTLTNGAGDWTYTEATGVLDFVAGPIPEPSSLALLALGGMLVGRRRRS